MSDSAQERERITDQWIHRVRGLATEVAVSATKRRRRQRVLAIAGVALILAVTISLGSLTRMTAAIDADAVAQIGRQQVEQRLPGARRHVQEYLAREAPRIVRGTIQTLLESLPRIRSLALGGILGHFDAINQAFEKNTTTLLTQIAHRTREEIDAAYPEASDREKLERLFARIATGFESAIENSTDQLYPEYHAEMARIGDHLESLHSQPMEQLTEQQRLHKEILETLLQLLARRQQAVASPGK